MLLDILFQTQGLDKSRAIMVGDRLDTDIEFGRAGGIDTLLVLTGVTTRKLAMAASGDQLPTYGIASLGDVGKGLQMSKTRYQPSPSSPKGDLLAA
jgi:4-nitrophenyl phosphatase